MTQNSKTQPAVGAAGRGNLNDSGEQRDDNNHLQGSQPVERLSITVRRHLGVESGLPAWVRIRNTDGVSLKVRPGPATTLVEFDELVRQARLLLMGRTR